MYTRVDLLRHIRHIAYANLSPHFAPQAQPEEITRARVAKFFRCRYTVRVRNYRTYSSDEWIIYELAERQRGREKNKKEATRSARKEFLANIKRRNETRSLGEESNETRRVFVRSISDSYRVQAKSFGLTIARKSAKRKGLFERADLSNYHGRK